MCLSPSGGCELLKEREPLSHSCITIDQQSVCHIINKQFKFVALCKFIIQLPSSPLQANKAISVVSKWQALDCLHHKYPGSFIKYMDL